LKRSRTFFWSADKKLRVCCTVSKRYEGDYQRYWYAFHPKWDAFLCDGDGFLILCCMDLDSAFAVPQSWFEENKQNLNTTEKPDGKLYWHIPLTTMVDGSIAINLSKVGKRYSLESHRFSLSAVDRVRSTPGPGEGNVIAFESFRQSQVRTRARWSAPDVVEHLLWHS
jgi:hypothetical protein